IRFVASSTTARGSASFPGNPIGPGSPFSPRAPVITEGECPARPPPDDLENSVRTPATYFGGGGSFRFSGALRPAWGSISFEITLAEMWAQPIRLSAPHEAQVPVAIFSSLLSSKVFQQALANSRLVQEAA